MSDNIKIRQREEIPAEDTWALEHLYASDELWEQELNTLAEDGEYLAVPESWEKAARICSPI